MDVHGPSFRADVHRGRRHVPKGSRSPQEQASQYDIAEFEELFRNRPVEHITTAGTDGLLEPIEDRPDFLMSDEDMDSLEKWYLAFCEKRELLGMTNHLLYICRKN